MPTDPSTTEPFPTEFDRDTADRDPGVAGGTEAAPDDAADPESTGEEDTVDRDGDRVAAVERRVADLEADLEAVRGLLDGVRAVDETVERRASAALAKAEALEERVDPGTRGLVRERLPDAGESGREPGDGRAGRRREEHRDSNTGSENRRDSGGRERDDRERIDRPGGRDAENGASPGLVGGTRRQPDGAAATDGDPADTGAISSVGAGGRDDASTEESGGSLAARLRDAFR
jgi:hypothetical protein